MLTPGDRSAPDVILRITKEHLLRSDESELRVLDICHESGLSTSVIYGHFRSRQGLIDAALLAIYEEVVASMMHHLSLAVENTPSEGSFVQALYAQLVDPHNEAVVTRNRQMHLRVSATALARPSFRREFLPLCSAYLRHCDRVYEGLIGDGFLNSQLSARQWALFFEGQMLSRAFHDIEAGWNVQGDWREAAEFVTTTQLPH